VASERVNRVDMAERTSYTLPLPSDKQAQLRCDLVARGFQFREVSHAQFGAEHRGERVSVVLYQSGKLVIQGKGATNFIQFYLEPQLLGEARLGYEHVLDPTMLEPRIGVDESGKGDFFGPLVVAGVFVNEAAARAMMEHGVKDSKRIGSDARIHEMAQTIRNTPGATVEVLAIGPEAYNRLHAQMRNVNSILGWGHARVIENLLGKVKCGKAISDQFGNKRIIEQALMERGRAIKLVQRHRAESDLAVAAASIMARHEFVLRLAALGREREMNLPKGASSVVRAAGVELLRKHGIDALGQVAKLHFRTSSQVLQEANL